MSNPLDPYQELGLSPSASDKDVRNAYRKLVLKHHPDRNNNSKASQIKFNNIQKAYENILESRNLKKTGKTGLSNSKRYYRSVKDYFKLRIILPKKEVVKGIFEIKIFTLHKVEDLQIKLPPAISVVEKKAPHNIILNTGNVPTVAWNTTFVLLANMSGHFELGPAHYIHLGTKYQSERAFISIYDEAAFKRKQKKERNLNRSIITISLSAFFIIMSILGYNIVMDQIDPDRNSNYKNPGTAREINDFRLPTGTAPYGVYFGNNIKLKNSEHQVEFIADPYLDQVVFLVDQETDKVVRHNYIMASDTFVMHQIPDGVYYVKAFFGRDWNTEKTFGPKGFQGGFNLYRKYISFDSEDQMLHLQRDTREDSLAFASYRIYLFKVSGGTDAAKEIKEDRFF